MRRPTSGSPSIPAAQRSVLLAALLLLYLTVSLRHLTIVPPVYEDEPWQASTGLKLAREGVFGSDVFAGLHGMERRYYGYMPLHPLLLAVTYRIAGFGLLQTRIEAVTMGLLILLLTYALGRRLFDPTVGLIAVAILLLTRTAGLTRIQPTGILFLDMVRIGRYDIVVPVFGLSALLLYLSAEEHGRGWRFAAAGLCAGLAGLSHLYGAFWIIALLVLAGWNRAGWLTLSALAMGFAAPWLAYLVYVLGDLPTWAAQTRAYAPRFRLNSAAWYWANLTSEPQRYGPGLGSIGLHYALRPGFWAALIAIPASLVALWRHAARLGAAGGNSARALLVPAIVLPFLFALLITSKLANYLVTVLPIAALATAWGGVTLWRWVASVPSITRLVRSTLVAVALAVTAEGLSRYVALERAAERTTPYADFIARVRAPIPPHARVLGLHNYWFGMEDFDYRSFAVPVALSDPASIQHPPSLAEALDRVAPTAVLLDARMRELIAAPGPRAGEYAGIIDWLARRGFVLVSAIEDPTYGRIDVYLQH